MALVSRSSKTKAFVTNLLSYALKRLAFYSQEEAYMFGWIVGTGASLSV